MVNLLKISLLFLLASSFDHRRISVQISASIESLASSSFFFLFFLEIRVCFHCIARCIHLLAIFLDLLLNPSFLFFLLHTGFQHLMTFNCFSTPLSLHLWYLLKILLVRFKTRQKRWWPTAAGLHGTCTS